MYVHLQRKNQQVDGRMADGRWMDVATLLPPNDRAGWEGRQGGGEGEERREEGTGEGKEVAIDLVSVFLARLDKRWGIKCKAILSGLILAALFTYFLFSLFLLISSLSFIWSIFRLIIIIYLFFFFGDFLLCLCLGRCLGRRIAYVGGNRCNRLRFIPSTGPLLGLVWLFFYSFTLLVTELVLSTSRRFQIQPLCLDFHILGGWRWVEIDAVVAEWSM